MLTCKPEMKLRFIDRLKALFGYTVPVLNVYPAPNYSGGRKGFLTSSPSVSLTVGSLKMSCKRVVMFADVNYTGDSVVIEYNIADFPTTFPKFAGVPVKSFIIE